MQIEKTKMRREFISLRKNIKDKHAKDSLIINNLLKSTLYSNASVILCYVSLQDEIGTDNIIKSALSSGKRVAVPYCVDSNGLMNFYYINSLDDLNIGSYAIREPDINKCELVSDFFDSICIVPGLCFDKDGNRLGYGKGYYDRFLQNYSGSIIALCYNELIANKVPCNKYDIKVNYIISENNIFAIK